MSELVHVAAAAIINERNEVLISQRADDVHQGGLWEFPGGKLDDRETVEQALIRELTEELGIQVKKYRPLIKVTHHYPDKSVLLDVWKVDDYDGIPAGKEGQPLRWVSVDKLDALEFPAADVPIIQAINLPEHYLITGKFDTALQFEEKFSRAIDCGIKLAQLRLTNDWLRSANVELVDEVIKIAKRLSGQSSMQLMFNVPDVISEALQPDCIHLNSHKLMLLKKRPGCDLMSASCHTVEEIKKAEDLKVDFIVLSPVQATKSHPDVEPLGWERFSRMVSNINVPVYALGGVTREDTEQAWLAGGQGIAAISALWDIP